MTISEVMRSTVATGRIGTLYHGFGATLFGAGPRGAIGFGVFETLKAKSRDLDAVRQQPTLARFLYGYIAGLCAETTIYPIDTVRRRQQAHGDATPLARRNVLQALQLLAKHEGHAGMFKGLSINLIKNPIGTAVSFVVNDHMKDVLGRMEQV